MATVHSSNRFKALARNLKNEMEIANRESAEMVVQTAKVNVDKPGLKPWSPSNHPSRNNPPYVEPKWLWPRTGALYQSIKMQTLDGGARAYVEQDQKFVATMQETGAWAVGLEKMFSASPRGGTGYGVSFPTPFPYPFWQPAIDESMPKIREKYRAAFDKGCKL